MKYGIRIQNTQENKWLLFCCKSHKEKLEWLESFRKEQEFVLLDKKNKLQMTAADKYLAQMIAEACNSGDTVVGYEGNFSVFFDARRCYCVQYVLLQPVQ